MMYNNKLVKYGLYLIAGVSVFGLLVFLFSEENGWGLLFLIPIEIALGLAKKWNP